MDVVLVDQPSSGIARILINRPAKRNAIDYDVREQMYHALVVARDNTDTRAIVLGGVEGVFSAGGDLDSMGGLDESGARERLAHIHRLCELIAHLPVPVVSAVEGFCAGAAVGMSLLGDWIVAGKSTKIIFPFMGLGLVPDWGAMLTLPRRIGVGPARRLMTSGDVTSGAQAFELGLADEYAENDDVMALAIARAEAFSKLPQEAFARFKQRMNHPSIDIESELRRELDDQVVLLQGPEFAEGYDAVMTKRKPDFAAYSRAELVTQHSANSSDD